MTSGEAVAFVRKPYTGIKNFTVFCEFVGSYVQECTTNQQKTFYLNTAC